MFSEDTIFDVVGCLEFEPGNPTPKSHREYLKSMAKFHQVIPITNTELLSKIHQTYRVQYIQDVVLPTPSVFEENMLSTLSSFVFFNKVEIVSLILEDEKFLADLFSELKDAKTGEERRKELVLFLKEFCQFSQTLQPQSRDSFYKTLSNLGVLQGLEMTLQSSVKETKAASVDIFLFIVDFSPSLVREYMLQQVSPFPLPSHHSLDHIAGQHHGRRRAADEHCNRGHDLRHRHGGCRAVDGHHPHLAGPREHAGQPQQV